MKLSPELVAPLSEVVGEEPDRADGQRRGLTLIRFLPSGTSALRPRTKKALGFRSVTPAAVAEVCGITEQTLGNLSLKILPLTAMI